MKPGDIIMFNKANEWQAPEDIPEQVAILLSFHARKALRNEVS
jgi:hypothetical protein